MGRGGGAWAAGPGSGSGADGATEAPTALPKRDDKVALMKVMELLEGIGRRYKSHEEHARAFPADAAFTQKASQRVGTGGVLGGLLAGSAAMVATRRSSGLLRMGGVIGSWVVGSGVGRIVAADQAVGELFHLPENSPLGHDVRAVLRQYAEKDGMLTKRYHLDLFTGDVGTDEGDRYAPAQQEVAETPQPQVAQRGLGRGGQGGHAAQAPQTAAAAAKGGADTFDSAAYFDGQQPQQFEAQASFDAQEQQQQQQHQHQQQQARQGPFGFTDPFAPPPPLPPPPPQSSVSEAAGADPFRAKQEKLPMYADDLMDDAYDNGLPSTPATASKSWAEVRREFYGGGSQ